MANRKSKPTRTFLCWEHGEEFIVEASSMEDAQEQAAMWGGCVLREVKATKLKNGAYQFEK